MVPNTKNSRNSEIYLKRKTNSGLLIPLSVLEQRPLTVLESLVLYLKEKEHLKFLQISKLLNKDRRNVRKAYFNAKSKPHEEIKISEKVVPVSIFSNKKLSPTENLVVYLKDNLKLTYHEIAVLLARNDRTIWTVYSRSRKKNVK